MCGKHLRYPTVQYMQDKCKFVTTLNEKKNIVIIS
jgi:hypothetical protein